MEANFNHFICDIVPRFNYEGIGYTLSNITQDDNYHYVDAVISITRNFIEIPVIWATLKLRLMYNERTNLWSAFKIWEFLVDPYENTINTYRIPIIRNVEYMEAVWDITNIMSQNISELAGNESHNYDLDYMWPEYRYQPEDFYQVEDSFTSNSMSNENYGQNYFVFGM